MELRRLVAASLAVAGAAAAAAQDGGLRFEVTLDLEVGEAASICPCPVYGVICDDPAVAAPVELGKEVGLKGLAPGATLCSGRDAMGVRRFYRVSVRSPPPDGGKR